MSISGDYVDRVAQAAQLYEKNKEAFHASANQLEAAKYQIEGCCVDSAIPENGVLNKAEVRKTHEEFCKRLKELREPFENYETICREIEQVVAAYKGQSGEEGGYRLLELCNPKLFEQVKQEIVQYNTTFPQLEKYSQELRDLKDRAVKLSLEAESALSFIFDLVEADSIYSPVRFLIAEWEQKRGEWQKLPSDALELKKKIDDRYYELKEGRVDYENENVTTFKDEVAVLQSTRKKIEKFLSAAEKDIQSEEKPELRKVQTVFEIYVNQRNELKQASAGIETVKIMLDKTMPSLQDSLGWYVQLVQNRGNISFYQKLSNAWYGAV